MTLDELQKSAKAVAESLSYRHGPLSQREQSAKEFADAVSDALAIKRDFRGHDDFVICRHDFFASLLKAASRRNVEPVGYTFTE